MIKANDIVIWKDLISEKQYVSKVLDVYKCESSSNNDLADIYVYRVTDVVDYVCEPKFIYDYNILEVYKKENKEEKVLGDINE